MGGRALITLSDKPKCRVCDKDATKRLKATAEATTCDKHFQVCYDAFKHSIENVRLKYQREQQQQEQEQQQQQQQQQPPKPKPPVVQEQEESTTGSSSSSGGAAADKYDIEKIYADSNPAQMIYMDMNNPSKDPLFRNDEGEGLVKGQFGGWRSQGGSNGQLRVELWQDNGIRDCEGTVYAKWLQDVNTGESGAYLFQVYRGGGSHSSQYHEGQEGAAYKGRIREDLSVVIAKELRHADYASNQGNIRKLKKNPKETFLGVKLVVYNLKPLSNNNNSGGGRTPVKIEVWCDEEGMDSQGNFDPKRQNWQKYAEYTDKGGWSSGNGGGNPGIEIGNTGLRKPDEILNTTKGAVRNKGNLFAYRTDHVLTEFKYMSWRKIKNPVGAD